jgi:N-acetylmuramoyl-L-alanine amidase
LHEELGTIGYAVPAQAVYQALTEAVVTAFQRRFRPERVTGQADLETIRAIMAVRKLVGR